MSDETQAAEDQAAEDQATEDQATEDQAADDQAADGQDAEAGGDAEGGDGDSSAEAEVDPAVGQYLNQEGLVRRYSERALVLLTNSDDYSAGAIEVERLQQAIDEAESLANSYIERRHPVPIAPVPPTLRRMVGDICYYLLHGEQVTDEVRKRYEQAMSWLRDIGAGRALLESGATGERQQSDSADKVRSVSGRSRIDWRAY